MFGKSVPTDTHSPGPLHSNMRTFALLALFLALVSSVSADSTFRRLRLSLEEAVHEKYLDLANLVTSGRTLRLVDERRNLRTRKELSELSVITEAEAPSGEVMPDEDRKLEMSLFSL